RLSPLFHALPLHDALPISRVGCGGGGRSPGRWSCPRAPRPDLLIPRSTSRRTSPSTSPSAGRRSRWVRFLVALGPADGCSQIVADRKSTRLNSSHVKISYA